MSEAGKAGNDPQMIKFSTKLGRCRAKYDEEHAATLSDLRAFVGQLNSTPHHLGAAPQLSLAFCERK